MHWDQQLNIVYVKGQPLSSGMSYVSFVSTWVANNPRGKCYLAKGCLDISEPVSTRCGTSCSICTKRWHEILLPVYRSSVESFLEFLLETGKFPVEIGCHVHPTEHT